ncbi:MAG: rRNA pseudouridine synthase [Clostridium sp.]|uniref:pseudouridine synthase n=1 Tax=Clostridium sp. TaxID=1506 RepID=UPI002A8B1692|nr:rRNA pseudouridine synthase [Clostridium sp.]MDY5096820.1 pseudouridine synthase [Clostridium sp.]
MRLDKFLTGAMVGTRKEVIGYVQSGLVKVNDEIVKEAFAKVDTEKDTIEYKGEIIKHREKVYYIFNKPKGCVTARSDDFHKTVLDYFEREHMNGVFHVGRLDKDTEGLLILTNDGDLNHAIMYPEKHIEKTYFFWALGSLDEEKKRTLENGISIGQGEPLTKPAKVKILKSGTYGEFKDEKELVESYTMYSKHPDQSVISGYITISEGRKHQVKRMLKSSGCYVVYLKRISIGGLRLDEGIKPGEYKKIKENEIKNMIFR